MYHWSILYWSSLSGLTCWWLPSQCNLLQNFLILRFANDQSIRTNFLQSTELYQVSHHFLVSWKSCRNMSNRMQVLLHCILWEHYEGYCGDLCWKFIQLYLSNWTHYRKGMILLSSYGSCCHLKHSMDRFSCFLLLNFPLASVLLLHGSGSLVSQMSWEVLGLAFCSVNYAFAFRVWKSYVAIFEFKFN